MAGVGVGQVVEGVGLEVDTDQGEQAAGLAVAGPEDLVVPVGVFPAEPLGGIDLAERPEEPGLQPFALLAEQLAGVVDVHLLGELAERAAGGSARRRRGRPAGRRAQMINPIVESPASSLEWILRADFSF